MIFDSPSNLRGTTELGGPGGGGILFDYALDAGFGLDNATCARENRSADAEKHSQPHRFRVPTGALERHSHA
jgi:hypothetical protein